jgi:hypothetical protein
LLWNLLNLRKGKLKKMDESEIEKYLFDPENPQGCEGYRALEKLVLHSSTACVIDPFFLLHYLRDQIFSREIMRRLYKKPNNLASLDIFELMDLYIQNYSETEFWEFWEEEISSKSYNLEKFQSVFHSFSMAGFKKKKGVGQVIEIQEMEWIDFELLRSLISIPRRTFPRKYAYSPRHYDPQDHNLVLFSSSVEFLDSIIFNHRRGILATTTESFSNLKNQIDVLGNEIELNFNLIVFNDPQDILLLIDELWFKKIRKQGLGRGKRSIATLEKCEIKNYFSIDSADLSKLGKRKEIYFLGENGDGKTLILQAMVLSLVGNGKEGRILDFLKTPDNRKPLLKSEDSEGEVRQFNFDGRKKTKSHPTILGYGVNRNRYTNEENKEDLGYFSLFSPNEELTNPVHWLKQLDYAEKAEEEDALSLDMAKKMLMEIMGGDIESIDVSPKGVSFVERGTELTFEKLSDGFRSVIVWLCDLVARLYNSQPHVTDIKNFQGIVLVDEIGLMLHPKWQYSFVKKLRTWFPKIQFFFTTHSPTVVLGASEDAVFYKVYKEDGATKITDPITDLSGYGANALLTSPLFDLETAVTRGTNPDEVSSDDYPDMRLNRAIKERIHEYKKENKEWDKELDRIIEEELAKYGAANDQG